MTILSCGPNRGCMLLLSSSLLCLVAFCRELLHSLLYCLQCYWQHFQCVCLKLSLPASSFVSSQTCQGLSGCVFHCQLLQVWCFFWAWRVCLLGSWQVMLIALPGLCASIWGAFFVMSWFALFIMFLLRFFHSTCVLPLTCISLANKTLLLPCLHPLLCCVLALWLFVFTLLFVVRGGCRLLYSFCAVRFGCWGWFAWYAFLTSTQKNTSIRLCTHVHFVCLV